MEIAQVATFDNIVQVSSPLLVSILRHSCCRSVRRSALFLLFPACSGIRSSRTASSFRTTVTIRLLKHSALSPAGAKTTRFGQATKNDPRVSSSPPSLLDNLHLAHMQPCVRPSCGAIYRQLLPLQPQTVCGASVTPPLTIGLSPRHLLHHCTSIIDHAAAYVYRRRATVMSMHVGVLMYDATTVHFVSPYSLVSVLCSRHRDRSKSSLSWKFAFWLLVASKLYAMDGLLGRHV